jgi:hypothetical protein
MRWPKQVTTPKQPLVSVEFPALWIATRYSVNYVFRYGGREPEGPYENAAELCVGRAISPTTELVTLIA